MKVTITCASEEYSNKIYDMLVNPESGEGVLFGEKKCTNSYESVPDIMEFDLNEKEIEELEKLEGVILVHEDDEEVCHHAIQKVNNIGIPVAASYNASGTVISHSMYYCQKSELEYSKSQQVINLPSIDCSNVDVVVMDSGIDPNHDEFKDDNGNSNVVLFDWTQLSNSLGNQIVSSQPADYYQDQDGHGTACASLIAGQKHGFAKNAKIYFLRENGLSGKTNMFTVNQCLELMLAFQKAKKLSLYGLNPSRPTVFSNSWGYNGVYLADDLDSSTDNLYFSFSVDEGKNSKFWNRLPGVNSSTDAYFRLISQEGVHVLVSAGNDNVYLKNNPCESINLHYFQNEGNWYAIPRTSSNLNSYSINSSYVSSAGVSYVYAGWARSYLYSSPGPGVNQNKEVYPIIIVGDICPIGDFPSSGNSYWSGGNIISAYNVLKSVTSENRILKNNNRSKNTSGPFFIKSAYSSFGPDVDVYAPGNAAWAALSSFKSATTVPKANNNKDVFFNGTSSSCPIVAGILATYLSQNPTATPLQAKNWLTSSSISGSIMETQKNTLPVSSVNNSGQVESINMAFGANYAQLRENSLYKLQKADSSFLTADIEDVLFCNRFFDSNNLMPQAFPARKVISNIKKPQLSGYGVTLVQSGITSYAPTNNDSNLT
jgi:subtilisin family serine protease